MGVVVHDGVVLIGMAVGLARALRGLGRVHEVAFAAVWMAVVLVEGLMSAVVGWGVGVVEGVCGVLDWMGADY